MGDLGDGLVAASQLLLSHLQAPLRQVADRRQADERRKSLVEGASPPPATVPRVA